MSLAEVSPKEETSKTCPQCAETIKAAAKICRFCRYEFPPHTVSPVQASDATEAPVVAFPAASLPSIQVNTQLSPEVQRAQILDRVHKLKTTGYVEDAEELIGLLGGTIAYQKGGQILMSVLGHERSFGGMYEMVQWTISELIPRVAPSNEAVVADVVQATDEIESRRERLAAQYPDELRSYRYCCEKDGVCLCLMQMRSA